MTSQQTTPSTATEEMAEETAEETVQHPEDHWRILVGFDGSLSDRAALAWALDAANAFDAGVVVVHAIGLLEGAQIKAHPDHFAAVGERLRTVIEEVAGTASPAVELCLQAGDPVDVMLAVVRDQHPQMVVLGRRTSGDVAETWLGSVSRELVSRCPVPTVVVPA